MVVEALQTWLCERWPDYEPIEHLEGTYGLVFVLEASESSIYPKKFCVKTVNPAKLKPGGCDLKSLFERELRLWLTIPHHYHVLPAIGLEIAPPPGELASKFEVLPLARMPFCEASFSGILRGNITMLPADRLISLAQVCSGLHWLYLHGLQGHGDLKPDNILLRDLRTHFVLPETGGVPSRDHPWQACVADFGWADIWCNGGGTYHAWRPYLAPERFKNTVVPEASDIFALGIIACELLSGVHPGGDRTESLAKRWNAKKWEAWAASGQRVVNVESTGLRDVLLRCLAADPADRPRAEDVGIVLCEILEDTYGLDLAPQLKAQDEEVGKLPRSVTWAAEEVSRVGPDQLDKSVSHLEKELRELDQPQTTPQIAKFLQISTALQRLLLRRKHPQDRGRVEHLALAVLDVLLDRSEELDLRKEVLGESYSADLEPKEVLWGYVSSAFNNLKDVTGVGEAKLRECRDRIQVLEERGQFSHCNIPGN